MTEDLGATTRRYAADIRSTNRVLLEKALHMRCLAYLSKAKAGLLTQTIVEVNRAKRSLQASYEHLSTEQRVITQQKAELEAVNDELRSFSYAVSHDLRAPLRAINGFSQMLHDDYGDLLDGRGRDYLNRICLASSRMSDLIEGMLVLGQVARAELHRLPVDLSAMAWEILRELQESSPERPVSLQVEEHLGARADRKLMQSVLQNLLGNAWKYTGLNAAPRIRFGRTTHSGATCFFVADNGTGFDLRYAQRLYTPFFRMHDAKKFPGVGIGLATVKRIVERHDGALWVESEVDKGTTFYFTLGEGPKATPA
ncbi:MAG: hypothetical protein HYZ17_06840 [Betaproteobacteria bacterium]|nr:hypothetical protein [Betaproteobacteria bacterium]